MNTFAAANDFVRPDVVRRKSSASLDEEAKIFLVAEAVISLIATLMAAIHWLIAVNYHAPWALWHARILASGALWPVCLILKAWVSGHLTPQTSSRSVVEYELSTGD